MDGLFLLYVLAVVIGCMLNGCLKEQPRTTIHFSKDDAVMD